MTLQIDLGNSFLKYRVQGVESVCGRIPVNSLDQLPERLSAQGVQRVEVSSVAGAETDLRLVSLCRAHWGVDPLFARVSSRNALGLQPAYSDPARLGVDRWVAMLAARAFTQAPLMVIDAGSAVTLDEVDALGRHLGGYILPGHRLLQSSLLGGTARVRFDLAELRGAEPGRDTAECVASGAELVFQGLAKLLSEKVREQSSLALIFTGGDGRSIQAYLEPDVKSHFIRELVLDGLSYVQLEVLEC